MFVLFLIIVPAKCFGSLKGKCERKCENMDKFYYYDRQTKLCEPIVTCAQGKYTNKFKNYTECKMECASVANVKTTGTHCLISECLIDWGVPNIFSKEFQNATLSAFNPRLGYCFSYIKTPEYPEPKLFNTYEACARFCTIGAEEWFKRRAELSNQ
ncbi:hypothetical protein RF11_10780 [Thelohanellus kitauei]|uniref:BPTI/Kunitz inhibitor domain-containing protein n=1 Tax=Thelohanellus kitauei TaxID=669202 RepID=A0A0C2JGM8_THEKT|nr:hypothetical protein RF11_10780 [Thelohanellus kitauei]